MICLFQDRVQKYKKIKLFGLEIQIQQIFRPHFLKFPQGFLPGLANLLRTSARHNLFAQLVSASQLVKEARTGEKMLLVAIIFVRCKEKFQIETIGRIKILRGKLLQIISATLFPLMRRIFRHTGYWRRGELKVSGLQTWCSEYLEWKVRASAHADIGSLKQTK